MYSNYIQQLTQKTLITDFFGGVQSFELTYEGYPLDYHELEEIIREPLLTDDEETVESTFTGHSFSKLKKSFSNEFIASAGCFVLFLYILSKTE